MAFGEVGDDEPPWQDTMQICFEGHVITDSLKESPELGRRCSKDGTETITACSSCGKAIPGRMHYPNITDFSATLPAPEHCEHCGDSYPWAGKSGPAHKNAVAVDDVLNRLFQRFNDVVKQLRQRHDGRTTLDISDEYDVQDLLHGLLRLSWDDVRPEEWTPSYAGKAARVDFYLPTEHCVLEVKMTRPGMTQKVVGEQLLIGYRAIR